MVTMVDDDRTNRAKDMGHNGLDRPSPGALRPVKIIAIHM